MERSTLSVLVFVRQVAVAPTDESQPSGAAKGEGQGARTPSQNPVTIFTDYETCPINRKVKNSTVVKARQSQTSDEKWP